mmetsp:Transcript_36457/g.102972  ORF Transcript_36457/g.102972 Transcript_36457/m.102972 type:complete len:412 (-) Transcript_36457:166-1401(-)
MSDVKDILGVSKGGAAPEAAKNKPAEKRQVRPEWMSREAFALLDNSHPIVPSALGAGKDKGLKEKPKTSVRGKVTWQWQPFSNPGRKDGLQLEHWVKCYKDHSGRIRAAHEGEYHFAKFNKKASLIVYTDEEYISLLASLDPRWSRSETDYLMDLCVQFDLRWNIIADRYHFEGGPKRSMEDMKLRYFSLAKALLVAREGEDAVANHQYVKLPYNFGHEMERKRQLALSWARLTGTENPEDAWVLEEAAAIEARRKVEAKAAQASVISQENRPAAAAAASAVIRPEAPAEEGFPSLFSPLGTPLKPKAGVYARSAHTQEVGNTQVAGLIGGTRAQKTVDITLLELGIKGPPTVPTRAVCGAWLALRAEVIQVLELKKRVQSSSGGADSDKRHKRKGQGDQGGRPGKRGKSS